VVKLTLFLDWLMHCTVEKRGKVSLTSVPDPLNISVTKIMSIYSQLNTNKKILTADTKKEGNLIRIQKTQVK